MTDVHDRNASPLDILRKYKINAIVTIDDAKDAVPIARALGEAGIQSLEITMRTPAALKSIEKVAADCPWLTVGAGTVLTPEAARGVRDAGGKFCIAPGLNPAMVEWCLSNSMAVFPGVATGTEMEEAVRLGLSVLKVWPVEPLGGVPYLKILGGPFRMIEWIPSGGLGLEHLKTYLEYERVVACGCVWFAPPEVVAAQKFDLVRDAAHKAVAVADGVIARGQIQD